ncbi:MAG TPA: tetratricopeptide repeat protein [Gemmatimonadetes bacterium]|nr:tetratricopeptide repeat protein [Gemmatimonadota bacterium]
MMKGLRLNEGSGSVIEGWALFAIGNFDSDLGDHPLAADYLERALSIFERLAYQHGWGRSFNALSTVRLREGDLEQALAAEPPHKSPECWRHPGLSTT